MSVHIIIGKNFGDEGKGLAVDYFSSFAQKDGMNCLVIRHNGGGQAGHTVDLRGKRFVFHQLSSGSFRDADTFWAETFLPDLYKLCEEAGRFLSINKRLPALYASKSCRCVYIDDILINMALECSRGKNRHGSCGMGINEAVERSKRDGYRLTLKEVKGMTGEKLYKRLAEIRSEYLPIRLNELQLDINRLGEYGEMMRDGNILLNYAEGMLRGVALVDITDISKIKSYDEIIFEGAQGLLLDEDLDEYAPHLTASKTGVCNPFRLYKEYLSGDSAEIVYVSRSYVTRHGAGRLPYEGMLDFNKYHITDRTNISNEWQGEMRLAPHGSPEEFVLYVQKDACDFEAEHSTSLFLTHLNETEGHICSVTGCYPSVEWLDKDVIRNCFERVYLSYSPYSEDVRELMTNAK